MAFIRRCVGHRHWGDVPVFAAFTRIRTPFVGDAACAIGDSFLAALYLKNRAGTACGVVLLGLFGTMLLEPCVMLRYVYPMLLCVPFVLGVLMLAKHPPCTEEQPACRMGDG